MTTFSYLRPENTHKGFQATSHCDLDLLYWSSEGICLVNSFTILSLSLPRTFHWFLGTVSIYKCSPCHPNILILDELFCHLISDLQIFPWQF